MKAEAGREALPSVTGYHATNERVSTEKSPDAGLGSNPLIFLFCLIYRSI